VLFISLFSHLQEGPATCPSASALGEKRKERKHAMSAHGVPVLFAY